MSTPFCCPPGTTNCGKCWDCKDDAADEAKKIAALKDAAENRIEDSSDEEEEQKERSASGGADEEEGAEMTEEAWRKPYALGNSGIKLTNNNTSGINLNDLVWALHPFLGVLVPGFIITPSQAMCENTIPDQIPSHSTVVVFFWLFTVWGH